MKTINLTKSEAIKVMNSILKSQDFIPMASVGNGGAGFCMINPDQADEDWPLKAWDFRVVPEDEIAPDFRDEVNLNDFDVCVEFSEGDYSEQYLLWDIEHYLSLND